MNGANPIDLLFGGMAKLGPGSDADTLHVLNLLPQLTQPFVVDAGCGTGRQTLALAAQLQTVVHAVDTHEPFLTQLAQRAQARGIGHLVQTHCMDIAEIPHTFRAIDVLWSEGAAYSIGFAHALQIWRDALQANGYLVVSELSWLQQEAPAEVRRFFAAGYPEMRSMAENRALAEAAGYKILGLHTLPRAAWREGYYDVLQPRAETLRLHPEETVRQFAVEMLEEIACFARAEESYGYVFYVLQKDWGNKDGESNAHVIDRASLNARCQTGRP